MNVATLAGARGIRSEVAASAVKEHASAGLGPATAAVRANVGATITAGLGAVRGAAAGAAEAAEDFAGGLVPEVGSAIRWWSAAGIAAAVAFGLGAIAFIVFQVRKGLT